MGKVFYLRSWDSAVHLPHGFQVSFFHGTRQRGESHLLQAPEILFSLNIDYKELNVLVYTLL